MRGFRKTAQLVAATMRSATRLTIRRRVVVLCSVTSRKRASPVGKPTDTTRTTATTWSEPSVQFKFSRLSRILWKIRYREPHRETASCSLSGLSVVIVESARFPGSQPATLP